MPTRLLLSFAFATTVQPSCHVQNFIVFICFKFGMTNHPSDVNYARRIWREIWSQCNVEYMSHINLSWLTVIWLLSWISKCLQQLATMNPINYVKSKRAIEFSTMYDVFVWYKRTIFQLSDKHTSKNYWSVILTACDIYQHVMRLHKVCWVISILCGKSVTNIIIAIQ